MAANAFAAFARGAVNSFGDIFRSAIRFEQLGAQFRVLVGDAEQAEAALREVSQFAAGTPFDNPSVERAASQLLTFGTDVGQLNSRLTDLGNIAGVANRSIAELATIFGQVNAQGRLTGERFNQLVEGGVNLGDALANRLGIPVTMLRDAIMRGAVSADVFNEAITDLGNQFGGIEALANTLGGQISTLGSNFELLRRTIGGEFTQVLTDIVRAFNDAFAAIQPLAQAISRIVVQRVIEFFQDFRESLDDAGSTINQVRGFLEEHRAIIIRIISAYALYIGVLATVRTATLAYGLATSVIGPAIAALRTIILGTRTALIFTSRAFLALGGFLATTFTAILGVLLTPIGAIGAAIVALGVVGTGFSNELASAFVTAQRAGVQLAQAFTTTGIVIESVFREVGGAIIRLLAPPIRFITEQLSGLIRRIPETFRPQVLTDFANELDAVNLDNFARDLETGESGLFAFNMALGQSDARLATLQMQLDANASNISFGEQLSASFNESLNSLQSAAVNNEFLGPIIDQVQSFRMSLGNIPTEGLSAFVDTGRGLLTSLREALVDGQIPMSLRSLLTGVTEEIANTQREIEDENARRDRAAAENADTTTMQMMMTEETRTTQQIAALNRRNEMIAMIRLNAMEQLELMDADARIREIEQTNLNNSEDLQRLTTAEQARIDIVTRFALLRANATMDSNGRAVAVEQAQANQSVDIARRAAAERMRLAMQEMRQSIGLAAARDQLLNAALASERLGANERRAILTAQAVINAYAGASRAFVDYPYPASLAVAAASVAAGLVQVDNIQNAPRFQQGGIVPGTSFTGDQVNARVNSGELILNRAQQSSLAGQIRTGEQREGAMEARLASIEALLSRPTIIQNANGQMFAEITREGIRDGVNING